MCTQIVLAPIQCTCRKKSGSDPKKNGAVRIRSRLHRALGSKLQNRNRSEINVLKEGLVPEISIFSVYFYSLLAMKTSSKMERIVLICIFQFDFSHS